MVLWVGYLSSKAFTGTFYGLVISRPRPLQGHFTYICLSNTSIKYMIRLMIRLISQIRKLKHRGIAVGAELVPEMLSKRRAESANSLPLLHHTSVSTWGHLHCKIRWVMNFTYTSNEAREGGDKLGKEGKMRSLNISFFQGPGCVLPSSGAASTSDLSCP